MEKGISPFAEAMMKKFANAQKPEDAPKYSRDAPFEDPVVRCDSCQTLLLCTELRKLGRCAKCGGHKVRNVFSFSEGEWKIMKEEWQVDPEFLKLFEPIEAKGVADVR